MTLLSSLLLIGFIISLAGAFLGGGVSVAVPAFYAAASLVTFAVYAFDKSAARNQRWRTSERTLHLLALAGGWPGAVIAQKMLHHKNRKQPFQNCFLASVIANCAALAWLLCSPTFRSLIRS
jgi:uncharacterized membrane protein YsdA (DUF1294 family)